MFATPTEDLTDEGRRSDPIDPERQGPPAFHEVSANDDAKPPLHSPRAPAGGAAGPPTEPTVAHPGSAALPEPDEKLKRKVPVNKVTGDQ
ncbi:hypothetical protein MNEG_4047 [Monoraphidium neglectum]|uniref:Uncharacterized protein n=1 Tax=Monoraphidium neglectum TaxID=145388 RepID=A0A0D2JZG6_9CHLO|nr:hypothetical protein MNEG_4047 [Monoraphidium neglectum]KIZ03908.1 hypothetical protein MNEG_4047 [Monoraphidium neglectum]|eukprot:XP_013902927.1 hypothetical protein MNEG_4047 [Monoraphidium neglectum]